MKILVVKLSSIGDVVHALPAVAAIRKAFPHAEISWAVERSAATILEGCPVVDNLIVIDTRSMRSVRRANEAIRELKSKYRELRDGEFDIAIDFQGLIKSAAIAKLSGAGKRVGFSRSALREPASGVLLTDQVEIPSNIHIIRKNIALAEQALGFTADSERFDFPIAVDTESAASADKVISGIANRYVLLNPAGGWPTKLWPAERFGMLADMVAAKGLTPVVVTAPKESPLAERVRSAMSSEAAVFIQPGLKEFFEIARRSAVYVGGDTGPTHIAIAAGTPIVGIFGPTEWWRNGSPDPRDVCVERNDIGCRVDCHRRSCSNWICLDIGPERVMAAVEERLAKS